MAQKAVTIGHTAFPLYTIRMLGDRHFLVAGGGGSAKTGIANAIEIYELKHDQGKCTAHSINHFETGDAAVMNCSVAPRAPVSMYRLATGQNENCQVYTLRQKTVKLKQQTEGASEESSVRKRKSKLTNSKEYNEADKALLFEIEKNKSVATDFSDGGAFQKCVIFSNDESLIVTGGADGYLRVWKHPSLDKLYEVRSHKNEIDDIDLSPPGDKICTISKDNTGVVWNTVDGSKKSDLVWNFKTNTKYRMRGCRFGQVECGKDEYKLFTSHIPVARGTKSPNCYLTKWNTKTYLPEKVQSTGQEVLSSLAISQNGRYLGVGTLSGSVSVYISFSLSKLYHVKEAHGIFVTGLEFAPDCETTMSLTGGCDCTMFSISADNQIKIHQVLARTMYSPLWAIAGFIILVYLAFWFIATL